jgi:hypothetical protein
LNYKNSIANRWKYLNSIWNRDSNCLNQVLRMAMVYYQQLFLLWAMWPVLHFHFSCRIKMLTRNKYLSLRQLRPRLKHPKLLLKHQKLRLKLESQSSKPQSLPHPHNLPQVCHLCLAMVHMVAIMKIHSIKKWAVISI